MKHDCEDHMVGIEIRGVYDGVLYWRCGKCNKAWHRWPKDECPRLHAAAEPYVNKESKKK